MSSTIWDGHGPVLEGMDSKSLIDTAAAPAFAQIDKAVSDAEAAKAKAEQDLTAAKGSLSTTQAQLKTAQDNLLLAQTDLAVAKAEIALLKNPTPPTTVVTKTLFGAGGGNVKRTAPVKIDRRYYGPGDTAKALADIKANAALGILTWVSFKVPVTWAKAAAGEADAWFATVCKALADGIAADDTINEVWVAIHHEPEGDADEDDWRLMQDRLSRQVPGGIKGSLKYWLVTTGWNQEFNKNAVTSEVDWETNLYPFGAPIYGIAYDAPYQTYGMETKNGVTTMNNAWTDPNVYVDALADRAAALSAKDKRVGEYALKCAIGEMGYGDEAFTKDKTWLDKVFARAIERKLLAVCYFDTKLNSSHTWWLGVEGSAKRNYFNALIKRLNA